MNAKRILAGGVLAGLVIVIGETIRSTLFADAIAVTGSAMPTGVFILRGVSLGIFCVLFYAAVRPRLGASLKTAITVGLLVFLMGTLFPPLGLTMQAFTPSRLLLTTIIWNAIQLPLAAVAGAWLYRETAAHPRAQSWRTPERGMSQTL